jgi:hypothetical protein
LFLEKDRVGCFDCCEVDVFSCDFGYGDVDLFLVEGGVCFGGGRGFAVGEVMGQRENDAFHDLPFSMRDKKTGAEAPAKSQAFAWEETRKSFACAQIVVDVPL